MNLNRNVHLDRTANLDRTATLSRTVTLSRAGRALAAIGMLGVASLLLAGCSSASPEAAAETQQQGEPAPEAAERGPMGVSGKIAVVKDGLLQVQDDDSQTAVTFAGDTAITQQVPATLSDVVAGACITAIGGADGAALTSVTITQPVEGECSTGLGSMGGGPGGGAGGEAPEGFEPPTDGEMPAPPDGAEMPEGGFGGLTSGKVTAVNGSTIGVEAVSLDGGTSTQEVVADDATVFMKTESATSEALVVGACVVAVGEYEGEAYAAVSLAVSEAGDGGCGAGFGGADFGGGGRGPGGAPGGAGGDMTEREQQ